MLSIEFVPVVKRSELEELLNIEGIKIDDISSFFLKDNNMNNNYQRFYFRIGRRVMYSIPYFDGEKEEVEKINAISLLLNKVIPFPFEFIIIDFSQ